MLEELTMKRISIIVVFLILGLTFWTPTAARACPLCADAIADANDSEDDKDDFPAAMNQSIYLMIGVPYLAFGAFGLMIYRGVKKNEAYLEAGQSDDHRSA